MTSSRSHSSIVAVRSSSRRPSFPGNSIKDLVSLAKQKPDSIRYASYGAGGTAHLGMEQLQDAADIKLVHIPYKQSAMTDVSSGQVQIGFEPPVSALPNIRQRPCQGAGLHRRQAQPHAARRADARGNLPRVSRCSPGSASGRRAERPSRSFAGCMPRSTLRPEPGSAEGDRRCRQSSRCARVLRRCRRASTRESDRHGQADQGQEHHAQLNPTKPSMTEPPLAPEAERGRSEPAGKRLAAGIRHRARRAQRAHGRDRAPCEGRRARPHLGRPRAQQHADRHCGADLLLLRTTSAWCRWCACPSATTASSVACSTAARWASSRRGSRLPTQAADVVAACRFPPLGHRSAIAATADAALRSRLPAAALNEACNRNVLVKMLIERPRGHRQHARAIAAVPGRRSRSASAPTT